jgi:outer membrane lipopolysaccharide assembly protein LptE/RlpB
MEAIRLSLRKALPLTLALLITGCAGYQLGPTGGQIAGERSILIPPVKNTTIEPRLSQPVTQALRRQIQQDGTLRLATDSSPTDLILNATIESYERRPTAFLRGDVITVQEYELILTVRVVVTERGKEEPVLDRRINGRTTLIVDADQFSAERQAAPLLADDFARRAVIYITEGAW